MQGILDFLFWFNSYFVGFLMIVLHILNSWELYWLKDESLRKTAIACHLWMAWTLFWILWRMA